MTIAKKLVIEKGNDHKVLIGAHVVQKGEKKNENKDIGHTVVTGIVLTKIQICVTQSGQ